MLRGPQPKTPARCGGTGQETAAGPGGIWGAGAAGEEVGTPARVTGANRGKARIISGTPALPFLQPLFYGEADQVADRAIHLGGTLLQLREHLHRQPHADAD